MPPEAKESQFIRDFYEMKTDIELIKNRLEDCSLVKGKCATHHDYITGQTAVDKASKGAIWKVSALTGIISALLTIILKIAHII